MALERVSRDPETAEVPYVADVGDGDLAQFAWNSPTKRTRNGLGLEVGVIANRNVSKSQKRITSLTLDGKSIL